MIACLEKGLMSSALGSGKFRGGVFVRRVGPILSIQAAWLMLLLRVNLALIPSNPMPLPLKSQFLDEESIKAVIR